MVWRTKQHAESTPLPAIAIIDNDTSQLFEVYWHHLKFQSFLQWETTSSFQFYIKLST